MTDLIEEDPCLTESVQKDWGYILKDLKHHCVWGLKIKKATQVINSATDYLFGEQTKEKIYLAFQKKC